MSEQLIYAIHFSRWKHKPLRLCFPDWRVHFVLDTAQAPDGAVVAVWGREEVPDASARGLRVVRIEDGFLRSVGLGADLIRPLSWVLDWRGIYFDATQPSDLEVLLSETDFSPDMLQRAAGLRERIVAAGLTKYTSNATSRASSAGIAPAIR